MDDSEDNEKHKAYLHGMNFLTRLMKYTNSSQLKEDFLKLDAMDLVFLSRIVDKEKTSEEKPQSIIRDK